MSLISYRKHNESPLSQLALGIKNDIAVQGTGFVSSQESAQFLGFESLDAASKDTIGERFAGMVKGFEQRIMDQIDADPQWGLENFGNRNGNEFQIEDFKRAVQVSAESMATVAMVSADPVAYAKTAGQVSEKADPNVRLMQVDSAGMDHRFGRPAHEAFDERELSAHIPHSATFAALASRQDEAAEALFPTATITGDQAGFDIRIERPLVYPEAKAYHPSDASPTNFGKRSLVDAAVDHTILADEFTRLVPVVKADNSVDEYFVPNAAVATRFSSVSGYDVPTRPILAGKKVNLLKLSEYSPLIGSVMDSLDAVDSQVKLEKVYVQFGTGAAIGFSTTFLPRNTFVKSVEGNYREMQLNFSTIGLSLDSATRQLDNSVIEDVTSVLVANKWRVFLSVNLNGTLNTEFGSCQVSGMPISVERIEDENGNAVGLSAGAGADLVELIEAAKIVGYDLDARRTNSNIRTRGHIVDSTIEVERYTIPLGSPITYPSPVHATGREGDIRVAITTSRFRNSNLAMTTLINYQAALKQIVGNRSHAIGEVPAIAGAGRWVVTPWYEEQTVDVSASIDSEKSYERAADVALTLVNVIRDMAYRAYRDSRYQAALNALTGGSSEKPILLLVTDSVIERHLMVAGDARTFGTAFDKYRVVSTLDKRIYGKIYFTFTRGNADPSDILSFGTHAWMPELSDALPVSKNNSTFRQAIVQPRNLHVPKLPIMGVINVTGLSKALASKTVKAMSTNAITNPYLPAL